MPTYEESEWGTANTTLYEPPDWGIGPSEWGVANTAVEDPSSSGLGPSFWSGKNVTLTDPDPDITWANSAWGKANVTLTEPGAIGEPVAYLGSVWTTVEPVRWDHVLDVWVSEE